MFNNDYLFTAESVAPGHPDKLCDQISDQILDLFLSHDPNAKVACECMALPNNLIIGGEISSTYKASTEEIEEIARQKIKEIGYTKPPFSWDSIRVQTLLNRQSPDIAMGVNASSEKEEGAGDQGIMFGYATKETKVLMPASIYYAHKILKNILAAVDSHEIFKLGPDGKSQVTLAYDKHGTPLFADTVVVSIQHPENISIPQIKEAILPIIKRTMPENWVSEKTKLYVNPTGRFVIGGPEGDAGLTGRKIIVDSYGGAAPHGGGAFSGKDPSKVDRSAAYAARYIAKNIVASGLADKCLIQISYAIGVPDPLSIYVDTFKTGKISDSKLAKAIPEIMRLSPRSIRTKLSLDRPIYAQTATFGHFGRESKNGFFPWEDTNLTAEFKSLI